MLYPVVAEHAKLKSNQFKSNEFKIISNVLEFRIYISGALHDLVPCAQLKNT